MSDILHILNCVETDSKIAFLRCLITPALLTFEEAYDILWAAYPDLRPFRIVSIHEEDDDDIEIIDERYKMVMVVL